jgi:tRNA pseudouridine38-40 synthase
LHVCTPLDGERIAIMDRAAKEFVGTHDFASYMAQGSDITDTVRTVYGASVVREGDFVVFRVSANGFLYNMVRIMTGTLLAVAEGKIAPEDIAAITESRDRRRAGMTAPAHGLYLRRVVY